MELKSHAKINLVLEVLFRRPDGFHQVRTILQELELHDIVYLKEFRDGSLNFFCDHPGLPRSDENLAFCAAKLLRDEYAPGRGARIELIKKIPLASGLGGGSSNAATVLKGLNKLWGLSLGRDKLKELGSRLGSDVPFFICGGTALGEGRGEIIRSLPPFPRAAVLLAASEGLELSAAEVYNSLKLDKISAREAAGAGKLDALLSLLNRAGSEGGPRNGVFDAAGELLFNDLEPAVITLREEVALLKEKLLRRGLEAIVSGSGPFLFALSGEEALLLETGAKLAREGYRVIVTETKRSGDV